LLQIFGKLRGLQKEVVGGNNAKMICSLLSCSEMHDPELHIKGQTELRPEVSNDVSVDLMWEADWQSRRQVEWDESRHGRLGYTLPTAFRICWFPASAGMLTGERYLSSGSVRLNIDYGSYDFLVYNHDYQNNIVTEAADWSHLICTTEPARSSLPDSLQLNGTLHTMPDKMYSVMSRGVRISDNLSDYEYLPSEGIYMLRFKELLMPRTFIYLVQVNLRNIATLSPEEGKRTYPIPQLTLILQLMVDAEVVVHKVYRLFDMLLPRYRADEVAGELCLDYLADALHIRMARK